MRHKLYYITGSKGGVGKSFVSNSLIFGLLENERDVQIIDTDDSNPDVARIYSSIGAEKLPLTDNDSSWESFLNKLHELSESVGDSTQLHVVVNGAARDNKAVERNGDLFNGIFQKGRLNYDFSTLWVLNDSIDSAELLKDYLAVVHIGNVFVFRNLHFGNGDEKNFVVFNELMSKYKHRIDKVLDYPSLKSSLARRIHLEQWLLSEVESHLQWGSRMIYECWLNEIRSVFNEMNSALENLEAVAEEAEK